MDPASIIDQNYKIWKCYAPFLYDVLVVQSLKYPSLTCQWYKGSTRLPNSPFTVQRLLIGTHSNGNDNQIIIQEVKLPTEDAPLDIRSYQDISERIYPRFSHLPT